ncbi:NUDIX domain-containing protein [Paracraurococcus lichenis]|uniref:ADP-ribose pyrophosphatase n=1 Tax=Paracraurococcus lichenis TaxID=3064888 RepID=A0ABT9DT09_9PROT|nr:NUDIX domain-containing protein [Paracraurococcus sp. LOR1-02]MDO9707030.1 NUDIX domain-containing protein [Paracraurococcus sp. LOR1-02]
MKARPAKAPPIPAHPGVTVLEDEVVWDGRFPLQRVRFTYTRFDGSPSGVLTWELWRRHAGVAVLPYDPVADAVALIEQFRLPALAAGIEPVMVECPAGLREPGETPEQVARRETREETGLATDRLEPICRTMLMQGGCDEMMHYYAARVRLPEPEKAGEHGLVEEHENTRVLIVPAEEAFAMLDANRIMNATAMVCLWWLRHHRARLRQEWA